MRKRLPTGSIRELKRLDAEQAFSDALAAELRDMPFFLDATRSVSGHLLIGPFANADDAIAWRKRHRRYLKLRHQVTRSVVIQASVPASMRNLIHSPERLTA
jgi:hypothetical protein